MGDLQVQFCRETFIVTKSIQCDLILGPRLKGHILLYLFA